MSKEAILREATFSPRAVPYHVVPAVVVLVVTIAGIPVALVAGPLLYVFRKLQYDRLRVVLTSRDLKVRTRIVRKRSGNEALARFRHRFADLAVF